MRNVALRISYDGTNYSGWQIQLNAITIQGVIQRALEAVTRKKIKLKAAGRTDTGVHAVGQIATFKIESSMKESEFKKALNSLLPTDIRILDVFDVPLNFHPRFDAVKRWYRYLINNVETSIPFFRNYSLWVRRPLNVESLDSYCKCIVGKHDFTTFAMVDSTDNPVREVYSCTAQKKGDFIVFDIFANSFLRRMVRSLIGTFLEFEKEHKEADEINRILLLRNREFAGQTAFSGGLYLMKVYY